MGLHSKVHSKEHAHVQFGILSDRHYRHRYWQELVPYLRVVEDELLKRTKAGERREIAHWRAPEVEALQRTEAREG
jgi:hypothetical protein